MSTTVESTTVYRVRIAHTHTLKDGWRLSETTVEATGVDISPIEMRDQSMAAYSIGVEEAKRRNRLEKEYNRGILPTGTRELYKDYPRETTEGEKP